MIVNSDCEYFSHVGWEVSEASLTIMSISLPSAAHPFMSGQPWQPSIYYP